MRLPEAVQLALRRLETAGFEAYVVGGAVRDALQGLEPHDYDLCTAAMPAQIKAVFEGEHLLETGLAHGTVTLLMQGKPLEITTFREETVYSDSRHPDSVSFVAELTRDLARRDFTVNAMAYSPRTGVVDPFGGAADLKQQRLRCVGEPERRFAEDALRILRALRFAAREGFSIEQKTQDALRAERGTLRQLSAERVFAELNGILTGRYVGRVLRAYPEVLSVVLPELADMVDCDQQNPHHLYNVYEHSVRAVEAVPDALSLRWAALYHDAGKPACKTVDKKGIGHFYGHPAVSAELIERRLRALKAPNSLTYEVGLLVRHHDTPLEADSKILRRRLARMGEMHVRKLLALKKGDCVGQGTHPDYLRFYCAVEQQLNAVLAESSCLCIRDLALDGYDLQELGLRGAAIGEAQRWLLEQVLAEPQKNEPDTLRKLVREQMEETT